MKTKVTKEKLEDIIKRTEYYYVNSDLNSKNFPIPDTIQTENWKLIRMDTSFTSQEALDKIKTEGCRPANAYELALWSESHRQELDKSKWEYAIALGQLWYGGGDRRVPCVGAYSVCDFGFSLGRFGLDWDGGGCLLCFCDLPSDTLALGKQPSDSLTLAPEIIELKVKVGDKEIVFIPKE